MDIQSLLLWAVTILLQVVLVALSKCPEKVIYEVQQCTASILPKFSTSGGAPASYNHVAVARDSCRDSRLRDAADCIQDILDRCKGTTEREQILQRLINKEKTIETVEYFCRHLPVYEKHAACISGHHDEVVECSEEAKRTFKIKMEAGATIDTLITGSCRFHAVARSCLTNTTENHCGREASTFVYDLMTGNIPPYCEYSVNFPDSSTRRWSTNRDGRGGYDTDGRRRSYDGGDKRSNYDPENSSNTLHMTTSYTFIMFIVVTIVNLALRAR